MTSAPVRYFGRSATLSLIASSDSSLRTSVPSPLLPYLKWQKCPYLLH